MSSEVAVSHESDCLRCRWKKICPSANFLVKYTKKDTGNALDGDSALELATHNYGRDEWCWWLLLDPIEE